MNNFTSCILVVNVPVEQYLENFFQVSNLYRPALSLPRFGNDFEQAFPGTSNNQLSI